MAFDLATIRVRAGDGGHGRVSFRREKFVPRGGPDGGDGGRGGDVVLVGDANTATLSQFVHSQIFRGESGGAGGKSKRHGKNGRLRRIVVPPGTVAWRADNNEMLGEIVADGQRLVIGRGGRGGWGNVHFKTPVRQAPRVATNGEPGDDFSVRLELKLVADVGLIGLPNAGKSSLLAAMTAAKPKIGSYPFTTLTPNLGVADDGKRTMVLADIPGLIEGAHRGVGLGFEFLRHIERNRVLVHLVDGSAEDVAANYRTIDNELQAYGRGVDTKSRLVVLSKLDLLDAEQTEAGLAALRAAAVGHEVLGASAVDGRGLAEIEARVEATLAALPVPVVEPEFKLFQPRSRSASLERDAATGRWRVVSDSAVRLARSLNFSEPHARDVFWEDMGRQGVIKQLERAGVQPAERVHFGPLDVAFPG